MNIAFDDETDYYKMKYDDTLQTLKQLIYNLGGKVIFPIKDKQDLGMSTTYRDMSIEITVFDEYKDGKFWLDGKEINED